MTTIVRWNPLHEIEVMDRRMRRLLDGILVAPVLPAADVYETETEYVFELEAPGYEEEELSVEVTDHTLLVKGEHGATEEQEEKDFRLHERIENTFERSFQLPVEADSTKLVAEFAKGVLTVRAPKVLAATPRKISIGARA